MNTRHLRTIALLLLFTTAARAADAPAVTVYPIPSVYREHLSRSFSITIDRQSVPVLDHVGFKGHVPYAACSLRGPASVVIDAGEPIRSFRITPSAAVSRVKTDGRRLRFSTDGPHHLVIQINHLDPLCLIADPPETGAPDPAAHGVVDVTRHGIDTNGRTLVTAKIQSLLDKLAHDGGGTLYFPPGVYRTGTLNLRSNISIYLAAGAVILGSKNREDFPVTGTQIRKGSKRVSATLVRAFHARNIRLYGRGLIDAGATPKSFPRGYLTALNIIDCDHVRVEGITIANSRGWTVFGFCRDVTISNFKSLQDVLQATDDCCDIVNCRDVTASGCLLVGGDDGFCIKACGTTAGMASTWGYHEPPGHRTPATNITFRDSVVYSNAAALKIGMQAFADVTRVRFQNIDIARTCRLAIDHEQGAARFDDIEFRDIRVDDVASSMHYSVKPQPLNFNVKPSKGAHAPAGKAVGRVLLKNVSFANEGVVPSQIKAAPDGWSFADIRCENLRIAGRLITTAAAGHIEADPTTAPITFAP